MRGGARDRSAGLLAVSLGWLAVFGGAARASATSFGELASRYADLGGVRIHYRSSGSGPRALVFLHGWGCDGRVWRAQVPELSDAMHSLFLDLPGHGRSDRPETDYTMEFLAAAVEAVLQDAEVEEAILVSHSNGVPVARQYYRLYPAKTKALIAAEGSLRPLSTDPGQLERLIEPFRGASYLDAVDRVLPTSLADDLRAEIRSMMRATPQHVLVSTLEGALDPGIYGEDAVEVPTLMLLVESPFWSADYEAFVRQLVPDLDYRVYQGLGHFLQLESPEVFNRAVLEFLESRGWIAE